MKQSWLKVHRGWLSLLLGGLTACQPTGLGPLGPLPLAEPGAINHNLSQSTITLWVVLNQDYSEAHRAVILSVFRDLAETFTRVYPGTQIIPRVFNEDVFLEQIAKQTELGFGPDIILTSFDYIPILKRLGTLQTLNRYALDLTAFRQDALKQVTYRGQLYGIPLFLHLQALCYNKTKVGQTPQTLEQLILQARQGYSVGIQSGFFATFWGAGIFGGMSSVTHQPVNPILQQQAWQKWIEWLKIAQTEPNVILSADTLALQRAFGRGQLAYLVCESSWIPYLREILGVEKLGVTLLPRGKEGPASPLMYSSVALFNRFSSPAQTELALRFVQFLSNVEQQRKLITEKGIANISSNQRVTLDPRLYPITGIFLAQSRTAEVISLDMFTGESHLKEDIERIERFYQKALLGEISAEEASRSIRPILSRAWESKR